LAFLLIEGIILAALGAAAIVPPIATLAVEITSAGCSSSAGSSGLVMNFMMRHAPGSGGRCLGGSGDCRRHCSDRMAG